MRADLRRIASRIGELEDEPLPADAGKEDLARFDWFADSCPCGRPAGECAEHPRARAGQRPPAGAWRNWLMLMGRGAGKTRSGAEWVRSLAESGQARRIALVAPTEEDARKIMIEGRSGILTISPPWARPRYEPSKDQLTWPGGTIATAYSADRPDGLRGPEHDAAWVDELAFWRFPRAWDNLKLGLRLGDHPRVCITTTPRPVRLIKELLDAASTAVARGSTYDNRAHLSPSFFEELTATYEGTRLGRQEIHAEVLEVSDGAWFAGFDPAEHVSEAAEFDYRFPVHLAIDCGISRHTAAIWFQVRGQEPSNRRVNVFGDWYAEGMYSEAAARAIWSRGQELPSRGQAETVRLDPASTARTGIGPAAFNEFARVFGPSSTAHWPRHGVVDGLDQLELLLDKGLLQIHPRCARLKGGLQNYIRARRGGEWLDEPADPQHPHEDLIDALRGGVRDRFPEGRPGAGEFRRVHASLLL